MTNFFVLSKPSVYKTMGNMNYTRFDNVVEKKTTSQIVNTAKAIKAQQAHLVKGITHAITKTHFVKTPNRKVTGISHLLNDK